MENTASVDGSFAAWFPWSLVPFFGDCIFHVPNQAFKSARSPTMEIWWSGSERALSSELGTPRRGWLRGSQVLTVAETSYSWNQHLTNRSMIKFQQMISIDKPSVCRIFCADHGSIHPGCCFGGSPCKMSNETSQEELRSYGYTFPIKWGAKGEGVSKSFPTATKSFPTTWYIWYWYCKIAICGNQFLSNARIVTRTLATNPGAGPSKYWAARKPRSYPRERSQVQRLGDINNI